MDSDKPDRSSDASNIEEVDEVPMESSVVNDSRVNITDVYSLNNIMDLTLNHVKELAATLNLKDKSSEFISKFSESFKNALEENIVVNGLPLKLNRKFAEEHPQMVDDALCSKLSQKVADVAMTRKLSTENCKRIYKVHMKHELLNLRRTEVTVSSDNASQKDRSHTDNQSLRITRSLTAGRKKRLEEFMIFCANFNTMKERVQCRLQERDILMEKLRMAKRIKSQSYSPTRKRRALEKKI